MRTFNRQKLHCAIVRTPIAAHSHITELQPHKGPHIREQR